MNAVSAWLLISISYTPSAGDSVPIPTILERFTNPLQCESVIKEFQSMAGSSASRRLQLRCVQADILAPATPPQR